MMNRKIDLENLIRDSYQLIRENDREIQLAGPKKRMRLMRENDEQWRYIEDYLLDYIVLCERFREKPLDEIVHISAHFTDLPERLISAPNYKTLPSPPTSNAHTRRLNAITSPLRINYHFVHPFMPKNEDELAQFVITLSNRGDINFSHIDIASHICLLLDISNSMNKPHKYESTLNAIPYIINALSDNDWLTIILFSSGSQLIWSNDVASSRGLEEEIIQRIDQSGVKFGRTYLASGLRKAINEFEHFYILHPEGVTRLYIFSDGRIQDASECVRFNPLLKSLGVEVNAYGFGQDFDPEALQQIMEGCQGGRIKEVVDTNSLWKSFHHMGEVAQNIVVTNAVFELIFSQKVTPGDAFRSDPGVRLFGTIDDRSKTFRIRIGSLEKERIYVYAFEARIYTTRSDRERIAIATLRYDFQGKQQTVQQEIWIDRTNDQRRWMQVDKEIENVFLMLEELRSNDPQSKLLSLQARLSILHEEGSDPALIRLVKKAIGKIHKEGSLDSLSPMEKRRLRASPQTTQDDAFRGNHY